MVRGLAVCVLFFIRDIYKIHDKNTKGLKCVAVISYYLTERNMLKAATIQYSSERMRAQAIFLPHLRESAF